MRVLIGSFVLILLATGAGLWATGRAEQRIVDLRRQLLTLQYDAPLSEYDRIERSIRSVRTLPWIADLIDRLREQRATSQYWSGSYSALALEGKPVDQDAAMSLLAANAAFRRIPSDRASAIARLDEILGRYAALLRRDVQLFDVAYNYEFVARTRDKLARAGTSRSDTGREAAAKGGAPSAQTIHGQPGAPAERTDLSEFKIRIPQRSDERTQQPEAGSGGVKPRKG